jgi:DNA gyrase/topoisomerase IV subunit A
VDEDNAETTSVDYTTASMTLRHFFEKEMIVYSMASVVRAIPSVMDGLKPSQRKVMYVGLLLFFCRAADSALLYVR